MVAVSVLIVLPYKVARIEAARRAAARGVQVLDQHLSKVESRLAEMSSRVAGADGRTQQVRKDLLGSVATAQSEMTSLLRSERTILTDALSNGTDDLGPRPHEPRRATGAGRAYCRRPTRRGRTPDSLHSIGNHSDSRRASTESSASADSPVLVVTRRGVRSKRSCC